MEKKLNDIKDEINSLVDFIKDSDKYKRYIIVRDKIKSNKEIMDKINKVKSIQKEIVKLEYNKQDIKVKEKELDNILEELNNYPIYVEYNYLVEDLNYEMKYIKDTLEEEINKIVN
jgi:cell fate (sporulation/competence/biofilm development) regulator YmcA (YheA/YmcA/DUF963 family)